MSWACAACTFINDHAEAPAVCESCVPYAACMGSTCACDAPPPSPCMLQGARETEVQCAL